MITRNIISRAMSTIKATKAAVRKQIDEKISSLSSDEKVRQSQNVLKKLLELKEFQESNRISIYLSTSNEVDTEPVLRKIFDTQRTCFVPRYKGKTMEMVKLHSMEDWENLPLTSWNIKQPSSKDNRENCLQTGGLDLIILPGVAFTKEGHRLGHGMGYYDKFLWKINDSQKKMPFTVAVAFKEQIVNSLPLEETDFKLDLILFPD